MKQRIEVRCLFVFLVILLFSCLGRADLLFDQSPTGYSQLYNCMYDEVNFFWCRIADDFSVPYAANIDSLVWWGGYWPLNSGNTNDFWIEIYPDSSGFNQPQQASIYSQKVAFAESSLAPPDNYYIYGATIPSFLADSGVIYWIQFMAGLVYPPFWGNNGSTIWNSI